MELVNADLADLAAEAGAGDLLVVRRVAGPRFSGLGGAGRGEGWAGNLQLDVDAEPAALAALASGEVQLVVDERPQRVVGAYWARSAAIVPVGQDAFVVLGGLASAAPDLGRLRDIAFRAALQVDRVAPGKRVADDLEVVHAVRAVMALEPLPVRRTLLALAELAAGALDAGLVVTWLRATGEVAAAGRLAGRGETDGGLALAMAELAREAASRTCQDATEQPLPGALADVPAAAWAVLPLGDMGALLAVHGLDRPRGFTRLCQDLGHRFAEAAECVLHAAVVRERLDVALRALTDRARRDELTGVANRSAWDEALAAAPTPATTLVVTVRSPDAGAAATRHLRDEVLRAAATALRSGLRDGDVVARLDGATFGVLLPGIGIDRAPDVADRLRAALAVAPPVHGIALEARISGASAPQEPSVAAAALVAEARAASAAPR